MATVLLLFVIKNSISIGYWGEMIHLAKLDQIFPQLHACSSTHSFTQAGRSTLFINHLTTPENITKRQHEHIHWLESRGKGGVNSYMAYMGTCRWTGYGLWPLCPEQGI